jgi:hypothetical protein
MWLNQIKIDLLITNLSVPYKILVNWKHRIMLLTHLANILIVVHLGTLIHAVSLLIDCKMSLLFGFEVLQLAEILAYVSVSGLQGVPVWLKRSFALKWIVLKELTSFHGFFDLTERLVILWIKLGIVADKLHLLYFIDHYWAGWL